MRAEKDGGGAWRHAPGVKSRINSSMDAAEEGRCSPDRRTKNMSSISDLVLHRHPRGDDLAERCRDGARGVNGSNRSFQGTAFGWRPGTGEVNPWGVGLGHGVGRAHRRETKSR